MKPTIKVYSKICLSCHDERWTDTRAKLMAEYTVKEYRTALNPVWHHIATKKAGMDDYNPFVEFPDGTIKTVKEVEDEQEVGAKYEEATSKSVSRRKEEKEALPKVRRNKTTKSVRKARVARKKSKTQKKVEA